MTGNAWSILLRRITRNIGYFCAVWPIGFNHRCRWNADYSMQPKTSWMSITNQLTLKESCAMNLTSKSDQKVSLFAVPSAPSSNVMWWFHAPHGSVLMFKPRLIPNDPLHYKKQWSTYYRSLCLTSFSTNANKYLGQQRGVYSLD